MVYCAGVYFVYVEVDAFLRVYRPDIHCYMAFLWRILEVAVRSGEYLLLIHFVGGEYTKYSEK